MTTVAKLDKRQYSAPQSTVHVRHPRGTLRWGTVGRYATADGTHGSSDLNDAAEIFTAVRPRLFGVAYRMLGGVADAEDIVQDVWLRWQTCDRGAVRDATAFLMTATTRLCINTLQSAHARRETHAGPWLPEPVDTGADPALDAERAEALKFATSMLLEKLPPAERAAYILREAFDYPYELIAQDDSGDRRQCSPTGQPRQKAPGHRPLRIDESRRPAPASDGVRDRRKSRGHGRVGERSRLRRRRLSRARARARRG